MNQEEYMRMAIELAEKGRGWTNPNPLVGAVIVKDGRVIGKGYHARCGELHAERNALADCSESPKGAVLYVTLEPCCHYGRTPPCTEAIIEAGIKEVIVGAKDPNPLVSGKGIALLREHGILVREGVLQQECEAQNRIFFHYMRTGMPYVILKYAMTLDGKIATVTGASKWITGEAARKQVHHTRHEAMGIMVGSQTVITDDPHLDCRIPNGKNPLRIICDTRLRIPADSYVVEHATEQPTLIVTGWGNEEKWKLYQQKGCEMLYLEQKNGHIDLKLLMQELGKRKIDSILLEGGAELGWSALEAGIVNEVHTYIAPKLFGGIQAKTPIGGVGVALPKEAFLLCQPEIQMMGEDIFVKTRVIKKEERNV